MAETPTFESPVVASYPSGGDLPVRLHDQSASTKLVIRADIDGALAQSIGVRFGHSRSAGDVLVCGQRPGEWVVLGARGDADAFVESLDTAGHVSVFDRTHAAAMFRLTGDLAARVLEKVCSLDWADPMTPNGAAVSASVALVTCDIVRDDDAHPSYLIMCDRSYGQYLFDVLLDAGDEFGIGVS